MTTQRRDEDPMLSVLLTEIFADSPPPELSAQILSRLERLTTGDGATVADAAESAGLPAPLTAARPSHRRTSWFSIGGAAALLTMAASAGWLLLVPRPFDIPSPPGQPGLTQAPTDHASPSPDAVPQRSTAGPTSPRPDAVPPVGLSADRNVASRPRVAPTPMEMKGVPFGGTVQGPPPRPTQPLLTALPRADRQNDSEIVAAVDAQLQEAWQSLAVRPADVADADVVVSRLEAVIGVRLPPEQASDVEAIRRALQRPQAQQHVAALLARQLLGATAWARMEPVSRDAITGVLAEAVAGRRGGDRVIAGLLAPSAESADQKASQAWLSALADRSPTPLVEQFGHAMLDLDLRCGRCHDHPGDRSIRQADYWNLAAALWQSADADAPASVSIGLFYELPDGRQRAASPGVPLSWLGGDGRQSVDVDRAAIANSLIDNPRLAAALINRLWKITYGHPLVGAPSDPLAPPNDVHLVLLRDRLADQLRAHDFDFGAAIAWITAAAPLRLQPPQVLLPSEHLLASDQALGEAQWQVRSFAAFDPKQGQRESLSNLLTLAARFQGGATLDAGSLPTTLAQPSGDIGSGRKRASQRPPKVQRPPTARQQREALLRASFPSGHTDDAPALPAAWLASLDDFDQQVRHLYYAAGYGSPTTRQIQSAAALRAGADSDAVALNQMWWAVQHSATP